MTRNGLTLVPLAVTALAMTLPSANISAQGSKQPRPTQQPSGIETILEETRTIDGSENNEANPLWGAAEIEFLRLTSPAYEDGTGEPSGSDRPSARRVSNALCAQTDSIPNAGGFSDFLWQWGQFLDHDITETPTVDPPETLSIPVPTGDPYFDPFGTGLQTIDLTRSFYDDSSGQREQFNFITATIDASNVYGSEKERAHALRTLDGTGKLKTSEGDLLPYNEEFLANAPTQFSAEFFLAGDVRANEQIGLIAMHTLFVREHNFLAERIASGRLPGQSRVGKRPTPDTELTGDEIYEIARAIVAAEMQVITYREFLPALLGPGAIDRYEGYDPTVDPSISNVFATAAYRLGHSMLSSEMQRMDENYETIDAGSISLADAFFTPSEVVENGGIDPILRGLAYQRAQELDTMLVDDVRNFLFGPPGSGGFDLAALNLERGRDHGLPDYNTIREDFGLERVTSFSDINSDVEVQDALASVYDTVDQIDPWIGMLCEEDIPGALVGETLMVILTEQFEALRDGDRFYYRNYLPKNWARFVETQTLSKIIRRNTDIGRELPRDVFRAVEADDLELGTPPRNPNPGPESNPREPAGHEGPGTNQPEPPRGERDGNNSGPSDPNPDRGPEGGNPGDGRGGEGPGAGQDGRGNAGPGGDPRETEHLSIRGRGASAFLDTGN